MSEELKYPVGRFPWTEPVTHDDRAAALTDISELPAKLSAAVSGLSPEHLDTPYRPGGWTVRQVVHHVADSHINAYIRVRLALTEPEPLVKAYEEAVWAELPDAKNGDAAWSLSLLTGLHQRWATLFNSLTGEQWERTLRHPELGLISLDKIAKLYGWHCRHHVAHITNLRQRMGW